MRCKSDAKGDKWICSVLNRDLLYERYLCGIPKNEEEKVRKYGRVGEESERRERKQREKRERVGKREPIEKVGEEKK